MTARTLRTLMAVLITALVLSGCGAAEKQAGPEAPQGIGTPLDRAMPAKIMNLPLIDATGKRHRLADFRGKIILLQDTTTLCQETCPIATATLVSTAHAIAKTAKAKDVVFISGTVDPKRDTVAQLAAYQRLYGRTPNWYAVTGTTADMNTLWDFLGVYRERMPSDEATNWRTGEKLTYDVGHSDEVFLFDQKGHERFVLEGMPQASRAEVPAKIYKFLSDEGRQNLKPGQGEWTQAQAIRVIDWLLAGG